MEGGCWRAGVRNGRTVAAVRDRADAPGGVECAGVGVRGELADAGCGGEVWYGLVGGHG